MTDSFNPLENYFQGLTNQSTQSLQQAGNLGQQNDQTQLNNTRALIDRDRKLAESIGQFSQTVLKGLVEKKKEENEEMYAEGLYESFLSGPKPEDLDYVDSEEESLKEAAAQTNNLADKIEESDGNSLLASEVRKEHPWKKYGRYIGDLQKEVSNINVFRRQMEDQLTIDVNGETLSYNELDSIDEYQQWQEVFTKQFLRKFPGVNPQLFGKYIQPGLQKSLQNSAMEWSSIKAKRDKADRTEAAKDQLTAARNTSNFGQVFLDLINTRELTRREGFTLLDELVEERIVNQANINTLKNHSFVHRGFGDTTLGKAFERDFGQFDQKFLAINQQNYQNTVNQRTQFMDQFRTKFEKELRGRGVPFSEDQEQLMREDLINNHNIPKATVDQFFNGYKSKEETDDAQAIEYLNKLRSPSGRGYLIPADLAPYSVAVQNQFADSVASDADLAANYKDFFDNADKVITAAVKDQYDLQEGEIPKGERAGYELRLQRAKASYRERFYKNRRSGEFSADKASAVALSDVQANIKVGTFTKATMDDSPDLDFIAIRNAKAQMQADDQSYKTTVFPGSESSLQELKRYKETRRGGIPQLYYELASDQRGITPWDIADGQLRASGDKDGLVKPEAIKAVEKLDPGVQRLINFRTTPGRQGRAVAQSGDIKWFLDTVASVESESFGGYDAYNLEGRDDGYTAIGSGNSAEDLRFAKPVSQLTLGEIMNLHNQGKLHAVGRYQFIGSTFRSTFDMLQQSGAVDINTVFDSSTQDMFAISQGKRRLGWPGQNSVQGLINEWRGIKFLDRATQERLLQVLRNEPYLSTGALLYGVNQ